MLCKILINERYAKNSETLINILLAQEKISMETVIDLYKELHGMNLVRDFQVKKDKAREVLKMSSELDEAKTYMFNQ